MRFKLKNGLSLGYRTRGAGRVVVFLHPPGVNGDFWAGVITGCKTAIAVSRSTCEATARAIPPESDSASTIWRAT